MPLDSTPTYEQDPPRWPAAGDLHEGALENDAEFPPTPAEPNADAMNQSDAQVILLAAGALMAITLAVTITAGAPAITDILFCVHPDVVIGDFTVTDNAAGDTSIVYTGDLLPPKKRPPQGAQTDDVEIDRFRVFDITGGARVKSKLGASATDCNFVLDLYGV